MAPPARFRTPFAGQLYFEGNAFKDRLKTDNEVFRLSAAIELGKSERWFGRHRIAGLVENSSLERYRRGGL